MTTYVGTSISDTLIGGANADTLTGNAGNDLLQGGAEADTYTFNIGDGFDTIDDTSGADLLQFNFNSSQIKNIIQNGNDLIFYYGTNDSVAIKNYFDTNITNKIEKITFSDGIVRTIVVGDNGDQGLGGALSSQDGQAQYFIGLGGNDQYLVDNNNDIVFENTNGGSEQIYTVGSLTVITLSDNVEQLITYNTSYASAPNMTLTGNSLDNWIVGGDHMDIITGGTGNDTLQGASRADTYRFSIGDGLDIVADGDTNHSYIDVIEFTNVTSAQLRGFIKDPNNSNNLLIQYGTSDQVTVQDFFANADWRIEQIKFSDGVIWNQAEIGAKLGILMGTAGNDALNATTTIRQVEADTGNDTINGSVLADTLLGQAGNDLIIGHEGSDRLDGGSDADIYRFSIGDGMDVINDTDANTANVDAIEFTNVASNQIRGMYKNFKDLVIDYGTSDRITIKNYFTADSGIEQIKFSDGVIKGIAEIYTQFNRPYPTATGSWVSGSGLIPTGTSSSDVIVGSSGNDTLNGGAGADVLAGQGGVDTYIIDNIGDSLFSSATAGSKIIIGVDNYDLRANYKDDANVIVEYQPQVKVLAAFIQAIFDSDQSVFMPSVDLGKGISVAYNFAAGNFTQAEQDAIKLIFNEYSSKSNIHFFEASSDNASQLTIKNDTNSNNVALYQSGSHIQVNDVAEGQYADASSHSVISINTALSSNFEAGGNGYYAFLHELGHAFGLVTNNDMNNGQDAHIQEVAENGLGLNYYRDAAGVRQIFDGSGIGSIDGQDASRRHPELSVMHGYDNNAIISTTNGVNTYASTLGMLDLAALHYAYGVNSNARTGNQTYTFSDHYVWDGAGIDTFSAADQTLAVNIDLTPGTWIYAGTKLSDGVAANLIADGQGFIGFGTTIENLVGGSGNDTLTGNTADNNIQGGVGADVIKGGLGNDTLQGGLDADTYHFSIGDGSDVVLDTDVNTNNLDAVEFTNVVSTGLRGMVKNGNDLVLQYGTTDQVTITNYFLSQNRIENIKFSDGVVKDAATIYAQFGVTYTAPTSINGTDSDDFITASNTADNMIYGLGGNDTLVGGARSDTLIGGWGDDTYYVDLGDTVMENPNEGNDTVVTSLTYTLDANVENLVLSGVSAVNGTGNLLNNTITGNESENVITGGTGNDTLEGGVGGDTYVFNVGDGVDVVNDVDANIDNVDIVTINVNSTDILGMTQSGDDLIIQYSATDSVTISNYFNGLDNRVEQIRFKDNVVLGTAANEYQIWGVNGDVTMKGLTGDDEYVVDSIGDVVVENANEGDDLVYLLGDTVTEYTLGNNIEHLNMVYSNVAIKGTGNSVGNVIIGNDLGNQIYGLGGDDWIESHGGNDLVDGGSGNDTILSEQGNDTISAGTGNDAVNGGEGNDTYIFNVGDGVDTIDDADSAANNVDIVQINATSSSSSITRSGLDLIIAYGSGDSVTIRNHFSGTSTAIEQIKFNDGVTLNTSDINLISNGSGSTLTGTAGNDVLIGNDAENTLNGGIGNDTLIGKAGADTYTFKLGDGIDVVTDIDSNIDNVDVINIDVNSTAVQSMTQSGNDLVIQYSATDKVTVTGYFDGLNNRIEQIRFKDNVVLGTSANEYQMWGINGELTLKGGLGDDEYAVDSAGDVVVEAANAGTEMVYMWGDTLTQYTLTSNVENGNMGYSNVATQLMGNELNNWLLGNDLGNTINGMAGNDIIEGKLGNDTLLGGAGDDNLSGGIGLDSLTGGTGKDTLDGGVGNDAYIFSVGDGLDTVLDFDSSSGNIDVVTINALSTATTLTQSGQDLVISYSASDKVTISNYFAGVSYRIEQIKFSDNVTYNTDQIQVKVDLSNNIYTGTTGNDTIIGTTGANVLRGLAGNDTYTVNNAGDTVVENTNEGTDLVNASVTFTLASNVENLTLTGTTAINGTGNTADNWLIGNTAKNILDGGAGNDTLNGGAGADTLKGGLGNDTFVVDNTLDVITENLNEGTDLIQSSVTYTASANVENLTLTGTTAINATGNALNNILTGNTANNTLDAGAGNDTLDGGAGIDTLKGGLGDDTYVVDNVSDVVTEVASAGTDTILSKVTYTVSANAENLTLTGTTAINATGNTLNNVLIGNSANNTLTGAAGADTLQGGLGNDSILGGVGNDVYNFARGDGQDSLTDNDTTAGNSDLLWFNSGVNSDQLWFQQSGNNLVVSVIGTTDKVTINSWYLGTAYQTEQIKASDGKVLLNNEVAALVSAMSGFAPPAAGQTTLPSNYQTTLNPVLAANWS